MKVYDGSSGDMCLQHRFDEDGGKWVYTYATSGATVNTPYMITVGYDQAVNSQPSFKATAMAAGAASFGIVSRYVGVPQFTVASGCCGWFQIGGRVVDMQCGAGSMTGSIGHAIAWATATIQASSSAYNMAMHQVGFLLEEVLGSTTATVFLNGLMRTGV